MAAYEAVPMGVLDKITLMFDEPFNEMFAEANTNAAYVEADDGQWWDHLLRPFELPLDICFIGGQFARDLGAEPDADRIAIDLALNNLASVFGNEVKDIFIKGHFTKWDADPFARGAYAASRVGKNRQRSSLRSPVADKLFFAGEATIPEWATQVAACYISGQMAAEEVADAVL